MMGTPSSFFVSFSLRELVNSGEPGPSTFGQWGMGASIGGSTGRRASGEAHCRKSESLSVPVPVSGHDRFDEREFIDSLKAQLEKRIIDKAAVITQLGDIPGSFYSSE